MTAKGTVFLALEDETGMVNVTLWPRDLGPAAGRRAPPRAALRGGRRSRWRPSVINLVARRIAPLVEVCRDHGGPERPEGVRHLGHAGMRRQG